MGVPRREQEKRPQEGRTERQEQKWSSGGGNRKGELGDGIRGRRRFWRKRTEKGVLEKRNSGGDNRGREDLGG